MLRQHPAAVLLTLVVAIAGCEPPARSASAGSAPPPPPAGAGISFAEVHTFPESGEPAAASEPIAASETASSLETAPPEPEQQQPASAPLAAAAPTLAPVTNETPTTIQLSAGVALPQLLPEGTQIGVSVDYRIRGKLNTSSTYFLVVTSSAGEIAVPVELLPSGGTLQGFCPPSVRPEHKPFTARIDEQSPASRSRTTISNRATLATSY